MYKNLKEQYRKLPLNFGPLKGANGNARICGPCGDTMEFWVYIDEGKLCAVSYTTDGCEHSIQCGFIAAYISETTSIDTAMRLEQNDVLCMTKGIPDESKHCAILAVNTLKAAVKDYMEKNKPKESCDKEGQDCSSCDKMNAPCAKSISLMKNQRKMKLLNQG